LSGVGRARAGGRRGAAAGAGGRLGAAAAAAVAVAGLGGAPGAARAQGLKLDARPAFGPEGVSGEHWSALHVRLENAGGAPLKGVVRVTPEMGYRSTLLPSQTEAPFSLAPGAPAVVTLPVQGGGSMSLEVAAVGAGGAPLGSSTVRVSARAEPLLLDAHQPSRLLGVLRGAKVPLRYRPGWASRHPAPAPSLQVAAPWVDPKSGEPVLPAHAAEYGDATAVLVPSDVLARLGGAELEALGGYVYGGGTLAVTVKRPEDARAPALRALAGGEVRRAGGADHLRAAGSPPLESDDAPPGAGGGAAGDDDAPGRPPAPGRRPPLAYPGDAVRAALAGYEGGNVVPSAFGSSAPYGLGEVHLLAFDPSEPAVAADPWAQSRLVELVRRAHDRRAPFSVARGANVRERVELGEVRRQLDPNEGSRWSVLVAAALLVAYATLAGPLNFALAARGGRPLRALVRVAIGSAVTFGAIVLLGTMAKGWSGRAQRLSLVEASGGMGRGVVRRYRGFFTPRAGSLRVAASDPSALVAVAGEANGPSTLRLDRAGASLEGVMTLPWQTVVVREDGLFDLRGGLVLARAGANDVRLVNRLGRDLAGVVASVPGRGWFLLPSLRDGQAALASDGRPLGPLATSPSAAGATTVRALGLESARDELDAAAPGATDAWLALASLGRDRPVDWWPDDVPVALGQLAGGEGALADAGLRVGADRCLVRVLGYGGEP
jgi:hypothetical protein